MILISSHDSQASQKIYIFKKLRENEYKLAKNIFLEVNSQFRSLNKNKTSTLDCKIYAY